MTAQAREEPHDGFLQRAWVDTEPVVRHCVVVLVLLLALLSAAALLRVMSILLPTLGDHVAIVEEMEFVLAFTLFCLFSLYTIAEVTLILFAAFRKRLALVRRAAADAHSSPASQITPSEP